MTHAETECRRAYLRLQIVTAQLLLQVSGPDRDVRLADLLDFARTLGSAENAADTVAAFRAAQQAELDAAMAELDKLV